MAINWNTTKEEFTQILRIVDRLHQDLPTAYESQPRRVWIMDIQACHGNGCPLDLPILLTMPELDFSHDVLGIRENINRTTGKLDNYFVPRCALSNHVV